MMMMRLVIVMMVTTMKAMIIVTMIGDDWDDDDGDNDDGDDDDGNDGDEVPRRALEKLREEFRADSESVAHSEAISILRWESL